MIKKRKMPGENVRCKRPNALHNPDITVYPLEILNLYILLFRTVSIIDQINYKTFVISLISPLFL